jgi:TRAP-type C4-dicarboxylate transport system permease small subunit
VRIAFTSILFLLIAYGFLETRRWKTPAMSSVLTPIQKRRRIIALCILCLISIMVIAGSYFPTDHISKKFAAEQIVYYAIIWALVASVPFFAVREWRDTLKIQAMNDDRQERDKAFKEMVATVAKAEQDAKHRGELSSRNGHG